MYQNIGRIKKRGDYDFISKGFCLDCFGVGLTKLIIKMEFNDKIYLKCICSNSSFFRIIALLNRV